MIRLLFVLLTWLMAAPGWGQTRSELAFRARLDSLQRVFEREPPFIRVAYSHNWQPVPAATPVVLYVKHRRRPVAVRQVQGHGYLLPPGSMDSLALGVGVGGHLQWFRPIPAHFFAHGAYVTFGYLDRAHLEKRADTGEGERMVLQALEHQRWRRAQKLEGVRYQVIRPRVFGDGIVFVTPVPVFRK